VQRAVCARSFGAALPNHFGLLFINHLTISKSDFYVEAKVTAGGPTIRQRANYPQVAIYSYLQQHVSSSWKFYMRDSHTICKQQVRTGKYWESNVLLPRQHKKGCFGDESYHIINAIDKGILKVKVIHLILRPLEKKPHCRGVQVWHALLKDFTVLPVYPRMEWTTAAFAFPTKAGPHLPTPEWENEDVFILQ